MPPVDAEIDGEKACAIPGDSGIFPTARTDNWWIQPLAVFLGITTPVIYMTWAALKRNNY